MDIIADTIDFYLSKETAVAIGKFDGIHIGHKRLLEEVLLQKKEGMASCIFTFDPPPSVLFGYSDDKMLTTKEEKRKLFQRMGVDFLIEFPLNHQTAAIPARDFVTDILVDRLQVKKVIAGTDLSFGDKGLGNAKLLMQMAADYDFSVQIIPKVLTDVCGKEQEVSSSLVRKLVEEGRMEEVEKLLEECYSFAGRVVHGNHIGHSLGFPTINLVPEEQKLMPKYGVYTARVLLDGHFYDGLCNVGCKPTVDGNQKPGIETYIYDFDQNVYGKEVVVYLKHFVRPEQTFASLDVLKLQLQKDIEACRPMKKE